MSAITSLAGRKALRPRESERALKRRLPSNGLCLGRGVGGCEQFTVDVDVTGSGECERLDEDDDDDEADEMIDGSSSSSSGTLRAVV
jgi:hypothetical protein